jgi:hypothetical protein
LAQWDPEHERRYRLDDRLAQLFTAGWEPIDLVPMFGSATTASLYFCQPAMEKLVGWRPQLAHDGMALDLLWSGLDRQSDIAVICRLADQHAQTGLQSDLHRRPAWSHSRRAFAVKCGRDGRNGGESLGLPTTHSFEE